MTARSDGIITWGWFHQRKPRYIAAQQQPGYMEVVLVTKERWEYLLEMEASVAKRVLGTLETTPPEVLEVK